MRYYRTRGHYPGALYVSLRKSGSIGSKGFPEQFDSVANMFKDVT